MSGRDQSRAYTDREIEQRAAKVFKDDKVTLSVSEIEKRLARLRDVPVEVVRDPLVGRKTLSEAEQVKTLIEAARVEAAIEKKWQNREKVSVEDDPGDSAESFRPSSSNCDEILMGKDTIRNLNDLKRTVKLAEERSEQAKSFDGIVDDRMMKKEVKNIMSLTRQKSVKNEKITKELSNFWEKMIDKSLDITNTNDESSTSSEEISDEEIQKVIREIDESVPDIDESDVVSPKKSNNKPGFLSRIFHRS